MQDDEDKKKEAGRRKTMLQGGGAFFISERDMIVACISCGSFFVRTYPCTVFAVAMLVLGYMASSSGMITARPGDIHHGEHGVHVSMPDHSVHCVDYDMRKMGAGQSCEEFAKAGACDQEMGGKNFKKLAKETGKRVTIGDFCPVSCDKCSKDGNAAAGS